MVLEGSSTAVVTLEPTQVEMGDGTEKFETGELVVSPLKKTYLSLVCKHAFVPGASTIEFTHRRFFM